MKNNELLQSLAVMVLSTIPNRTPISIEAIETRLRTREILLARAYQEILQQNRLIKQLQREQRNAYLNDRRI